MSKVEKTAPDANRLADVISNYFATMAVLICGFWIYTRAASSHPPISAVTFRLGEDLVTVTTRDALLWLCEIYALVLLPYYWIRPGFVCDARKVFAYFSQWVRAGAQPDLSSDERRAMLTLVLKSYFVPLMVGFVVTNVDEVMQYWRSVISDESDAPYALKVNSHFYYLLLSVLFTIDVIIFTISYIIEVPALDNEIKSVDPTALGWISCLLCYPPFNQPGLALFVWPHVDFASFSTAWETLLACTSLAAVVIFVAASIALGFRASNLTNRGIVCQGPYRWVRHPAYATKNLTAWIAALPALAQSFSVSILDGLWVVTCVAVWTAIYIVRALTEERHLLMLDNGYADYMGRVRFRFVPGIV